MGAHVTQELWFNCFSQSSSRLQGFPDGHMGWEIGAAAPQHGNPSAGHLGIGTVLEPWAKPALPWAAGIPAQCSHHAPQPGPCRWDRGFREKSWRAKVLKEQSREGLDEHKDTIPAKFLRDHSSSPHSPPDCERAAAVCSDLSPAITHLNKQETVF